MAQYALTTLTLDQLVNLTLDELMVLVLNPEDIDGRTFRLFAQSTYPQPIQTISKITHKQAVASGPIQAAYRHELKQTSIQLGADDE